MTFLVALFVGESRQKCSLKLVRQRKAADHRRVAPASQRAVLAAADVVFRQFDWRNVLSHRERRLSSAHGHVAVVQLNVFGVNHAAVDEMSRALRFLSQIIRSSQHRHSADVEAVDAMRRGDDVVLVEHRSTTKVRPVRWRLLEEEESSATASSLHLERDLIRIMNWRRFSPNNPRVALRLSLTPEEPIKKSTVACRNRDKPDQHKLQHISRPKLSPQRIARKVF